MRSDYMQVQPVWGMPGHACACRAPALDQFGHRKTDTAAFRSMQASPSIKRLMHSW